MADKADEIKVNEDGKQEVGETDLVKAITEVEAAAKGEKPEAAAPPEKIVPAVEAATLAKTVDAEGSDELKKSLDVSSILSEFADTVGTHVDAVTAQFAKSISGQNSFNLALLGTLESLQKTVGELAETVAKYGEQPATPASAKEPKTEKGEALEKSVSEAGDGERTTPTAEEAGTQVLDGLHSLVKAAMKDGDTAEASRLEKSLVKFDSTREISDRDIKAAIGQYRKDHAA